MECIQVVVAACSCLTAYGTSNQVSNTYNHRRNVDNNFELLKSTLRQAETQLENSQGSRQFENEEQVHRLRRLCLDLQDLIQDIECLKKKNDPQRQHTNQVRNALHPCRHCLSCIKNINLPQKIATKLEDLRQSIDAVRLLQGNGENQNSNFQRLNGAALKCFHYLSLFRQQDQLDKEELILLWVGAGLVEATYNDVSSSLLEAARGCFNNLLQNSILLQSDSEDSDNQMYQFADGYAEFIAPTIYLSMTKDSQLPSLQHNNLCHLSVTQTCQTDHHGDIKLRKCLRTFISVDDGHHRIPREIQPDLLSKMTRLRVLVLKNTNIEELPYIAHLKRLRFLDISGTLVGSLPRELCTLPYLQILKFKKNTDQAKNHSLLPAGVQLPDNFSNMTALVYVDWDVSYIRKLQAKPGYIGSLTNLETLPLFVVTDLEGHRITELEKMNRLRNSLCITKLEAVQSEEDARRARIGDKSGLRILKLVWSTLFPNNEIAEQVLTGLKPHNSLKELHVVNYRWNSYPGWFGETSLELENLHLENCSSCNLLQSFGQLGALKVLHIEGMHDLNSMDNLFHRTPGDTSNKYYFTSLKSLVLNNIEDLEDWQKLGENDMPLLQKLEIKGCNKLKTLPPLENLTSLKHIEIEGCQKLSSLSQLPPSLQSLIMPQLQKLEIKGSKKLKTLPPLENLTLLTQIEIDGCEELSSLPKLPSSLHSLIIKNSKLLADWCQLQVQGEDPGMLGNLLKLEIDSSKTEKSPSYKKKTLANPRTGPKAKKFTDAGSKKDGVKRKGGIVFRESDAQRSENVNNISGGGGGGGVGGGGKGKDKVIYPEPQGDSSKAPDTLSSASNGTLQLDTSSTQIQRVPSKERTKSANPSKQMKNMENSFTDHAMPPSNNGHTGESSANPNGQIDETSQPEPCGLGDSIPKGEVKQTV